MEKIYNKIIQYISWVIFAAFTIFLLLSFFIKSIYVFKDSAEFTANKWYNYFFIVILVGIYFLLFHYRNYIKKIPFWAVIICYIIVGTVFILCVPLKAFSDMSQIFDAANAVARGQFDYFSQSLYFEWYPNNVLISLIYGIIFYIFPKSIITIKVLNIILIIFIVYFSEKIVQIYFKNEYRSLFYIYGLSLISVLLYINHIYTDIPFVFLTMLGLWLYLKSYKNLIWSCIIMAFAYHMRPQAIFYIIAMCIHCICVRFNVKKMLWSLGTFLVSVLIIVGFGKIVTNGLVEKTDGSIPVWSYIHMAFNEEEFGFQDGTHSPDWTAEDVKERIEEYGPLKVGTIIVKKTYWIWTEGTYQASRYAFGDDTTNSLSKFEYNTFITKHAVLSAQIGRKLLDALMRAQYILLLMMTLPMFCKNNREKYSLFILLFAANLIFYIFWEIKSRYLLPLYPMMIIVSFIVILKKGIRNEQDNS